MGWQFWKKKRSVPENRFELMMMVAPMASDFRRTMFGGAKPPGRLAKPAKVELPNGQVIDRRDGEPLLVADLAALNAAILGVYLALENVTLGIDGIQNVGQGISEVFQRLAGAPLRVEQMAAGIGNVLTSFDYRIDRRDVFNIAVLFAAILENWQGRESRKVG